MILITGSTGFVGKKLCSKIKNYKRFKGDIRDRENCFKQIEKAECVIHLAADLNEKSKKIWEANVKGTKNIVDACKKYNVKLMFLSTVGVSAKADLPISEKSKYAPETEYEKSKTEAEKIVKKYKKTLIIRSALVMGANKYWLNIVKMAKFPLISKGDFFWQTIYIDDLVDGILFLLKKSKWKGDIFVLANDEKVKLRDIYNEIRKNLGLKKGFWIPSFLGYLLAFIEGFKKNPKLLPSHIKRLVRERRYDIDKIKKLGWKPKIGYKEGIKKMIKEFRRENLIK